MKTPDLPQSEVSNRVLYQSCHTTTRMESSVLDVFYVAGIIVLFAIIALVARGVEKL